MAQSFREQFQDFGELAREFILLKSHNLKYANDLPQNKLLLFSEASLVCVALERFFRMILGDSARDSHTLAMLIQNAVRQKLVVLPFDDPATAVTSIAKVRNTLLHGNFEQAAKQLNLKSKEEYFRGPFIKEVEQLGVLLDDLCKQINPDTGQPWKKAV
jgi:hypothetical protein